MNWGENFCSITIEQVIRFFGNNVAHASKNSTKVVNSTKNTVESAG